jgi:hypothetical protein
VLKAAAGRNLNGGCRRSGEAVRAVRPWRIASDAAAARRVASEVAFQVVEPITLVMQVAAARSAGIASERLTVTLDGAGTDGALEVEQAGGRGHVLTVDRPGRLVVVYDAVVVPATGDVAPSVDAHAAEVLVALRQSRYCPSDQLGGFACAELAGATGADVATWVHDRLRYDIWATNPYDTAVDTLTTGAGVCRDFAHLTIALCRAIGIPARLVSVYAPGLWPMDFHAVVEVWQDGRWLIVDPTRLAPRQSLVRIATGRDAADTAFADTIAGHAQFEHVVVTATIDGDLPMDDHGGPVALA